jgi:RNA polymerase sigma-70 factor (ECF subfamily)
MIRNREQVHDEWLIVCSQAGQADALSELVRRWHQRLLDHARLLMRNESDAADALQEALVAIARFIRRLDDPALFGPWARRILAHKCADLIRQRRRSRRLIDAVGSGPPSQREPEHIEDDELARIRMAIDLLPIDSRALIVMRYGREMSTEHMAAALCIPEGTVKSRLNHARNELKSILERNT